MLQLYQLCKSVQLNSRGIRKQQSTVFLSELSSLLEELQSSSQRLLLTGDFNLHVDDKDSNPAITFLEAIDALSLRNNVWIPTHKNNHTLDLVIGRSDDDFVSRVSSVDSLPSDYHAVKCLLSLERPKNIRKMVTSRNLRSLNSTFKTT